MTRHLTTAAGVLLLTLTTTHAQMTGVTLPNGGWVPCDHPSAAGLCGAPVAQPMPAQAPTVSAACDYISPYTDRPGCVVGDYRIGQTYQFGTLRGVVIGLAMASTGAEVVTVQYVWDVQGGPLQVWAFINDGSQRPWEWRR